MNQRISFAQHCYFVITNSSIKICLEQSKKRVTNILQEMQVQRELLQFQAIFEIIWMPKKFLRM